MKRLVTIILSCALMPGCEDSSGSGGAAAASVNTPIEPVLATTYSTTGTWDLSGPFAGGRSSGDLAADFLVEDVADRLVPSFLKDRAEGIIEDRLRPAIKTYFDGLVSEEWRPGGEKYEKFSSSMGRAKITTSMTLSGDMELTGSERITSIEIPAIEGDGFFDVPVELLLLNREEVVQIEASLVGRRISEDTIELDPHSFNMGHGTLVSRVVQEIAGVDLSEVPSLLNGVLDCEAFAAAQSGDDLEIEIAGRNFDIGSSLLERACEAFKEKLYERFDGLLFSDMGVQIGGQIKLAHTVGDRFYTLTSDPNYGGEYVDHPYPVNPRVLVQFTGVPDPD